MIRMFLKIMQLIQDLEVARTGHEEKVHQREIANRGWGGAHQNLRTYNMKAFEGFQAQEKTQAKRENYSMRQNNRAQERQSAFQQARGAEGEAIVHFYQAISLRDIQSHSKNSYETQEEGQQSVWT